MGAHPTVGIIVVAYNAERTIRSVLDRIPPDVWPRIAAVWVSDDESSDDTHGMALQWQRRNGDRPVTVVRQPLNLGYGGNQKVGYRWAIERGIDIVVLLHGDGQYAPEVLADLIAPIERGEAQAVLGSRMSERGGARRGGMPLYKRVGNRVLTAMQNRLAGTDLSEWHSGYRAYDVSALRSINVGANSDGFDFDTEVLLQLLGAGYRIAEVPIPTYYGDEISYVNGMGYAAAVMFDMVAWRLGALGFGSGHLAPRQTEYPLHDDDGSHGVIIRRLAATPPCRVLDLGCGSGALGEQLRRLGHTVVGVDREEIGAVRERVDEFVLADLEQGLPAGLRGPFDVVVVADVVEHLSRPERLVDDVTAIVDPEGYVLLSVPNFGHWYPRLRTATGTWDYDQRGILDRTHLRFFSRRTLRRLVRTSGLAVRSEVAVGVPLDAIGRRLARAAAGVERAGLRARPTLFAYQFVLEAIRPPRAPHVSAALTVARSLDDDGAERADRREAAHGGAGHETFGEVAELDA